MSAQWYLKKADGQVYGPVELNDLRDWVAGNRVVSDDQVSQDQVSWEPAADLADLEMDYRIEFEAGGTYGPLHLEAARQLFASGHVTPTDRLLHLPTSASKTAGAVFGDAGETAAQDSASQQEATDSVSAAEWAVTQQQLAQAEARLQAITVERDQLREQLQQAVTDAAQETEASVKALTAEREQLAQSLATISAERDQAVSDLETARQQAADQAEKGQAAAAEQDQAEKSKQAELATRLEDAQQEATRLRAQVQELEAKLAEAATAQAKSEPASQPEPAPVQADEQAIAAQVQEQVEKQVQEKVDEQVRAAVEAEAAKWKQQVQAESQRREDAELAAQAAAEKTAAEWRRKLDQVQARLDVLQQEKPAASQAAPPKKAEPRADQAVVREALHQAQARAAARRPSAQHVIERQRALRKPTPKPVKRNPSRRPR
jgi:chromosome segregation ATPase